MKKILISYKSLFVFLLFLVMSFGIKMTPVQASACSLLGGNNQVVVTPTAANIGDTVTITGRAQGCDDVQINNVSLDGPISGPFRVTKTVEELPQYFDVYAYSNTACGTPAITTSPGDFSVYTYLCGRQTVTVSAPVPTVSLTVTTGFGTTNVVPGSYSMLTLSTTNATSCSAPWMSGNGTSGYINVGPINDPTTYTIVCTGAGGTTVGNISFTVTVTTPVNICSSPLTKNVQVTCDPVNGQNAISGSVTRSQTKTAYPDCTFSTPITVDNSIYVSDNCMYPVNVPCQVTTDTNYNIGLCLNTCKNGYTNYPTCTPPPTQDTCGSDSGTTPKLNEPTTNPAACNPGTYANSPANITTSGSQAWRWSCGAVTSCTAPKFGCRITVDANYSLPQYGASGPNNNYGCAGTCANGSIDYPTGN